MDDAKATELCNSLLRNRRDYHRLFLERPDSIATLLPYDEYIEAERLFQMKDGSLGTVYEVSLAEHEAMTRVDIQSLISATKPWFTLEEHCSLQFHYESLPLAASELDRLNENCGGHPVAAFLAKKKREDLLGRCQDGKMLRRRLWLSIRGFPTAVPGVRLRDLTDTQATLSRELRHFREQCSDFQGALASFEEASPLPLRRLDAEELAAMLRRFFNPISFYERGFAPVNLRESLSQQLVHTPVTLDHSGLEREGVKTRTPSLKTPPAFSFAGGMAAFVGLDFPLRLSLCVSFPSSAKVRKFLATKAFFLDKAATPKARLQKAELQAVEEELVRDDRCLAVTVNVIVEAQTDDELRERIRKITRIFHDQLECEVIVEHDIGLGLALNALPLSYVPDADLSTRRGLRLLRSDAQNFLPLFDTFRGFSRGEAFYESRDQGVLPFTLLGNETSNHSVVLADTGSGKSAFVIDCLQAVKRLSPEPIVFVIDKKSSYGMFSRYFEGEVTVFDRKGEMPFSPFRGYYDEEKVAFLTKIIALAVQLTSPSFALESEHRSAITKAIRRAYRLQKDTHGLRYVDGELRRDGSDAAIEIDMAGVVAELGAMEGQAVRDLAAKLGPFYGDGSYAPFFRRGQTRKTAGQRLFYVYDLDALDGDPVLQTLMTMAVIEEIRSILAMPEHRGRTGFLVMEEFAMLGRNNLAFRDFAIDFAETMRKRGCWLITLTPRPQNYFNLEVGQAFWGVADNFIFLQMSSDNVDFIARHSSLLDEANTEIIRSLRTKKGAYAEVFYMNKSKSRQGAFRFRQTAYDRWMSPTNALDAARALDALEVHGDKWRALEALAKEET